tara:strand:- start:208 stop:693 length:486 start_codon:yes stop_codon:yes gene_type:complete
MSLDPKKLVDAIKMFKKKIEKQGRVTNARDEEHLERLLKLYKDMGGKKKFESINERMDKRQAGETLKQLGGNRFIMMTGAKNFGVGPKGMGFKIGRNSKKINYIRIDLDRGKDLYNMEFIRMARKKGELSPTLKVVKKIKGVYADQLQKLFTKYTGMYTSL